MPDIIKLLLQAEIDTESSISKINADIKKIQEGVNGIKIETDKTSIKDTAEKFAGLNKQLKEMGQFDLSKTPIEKGMKIIGYSINDANDGTKKFTQTLNTGKDKIITYKGTINETTKSYEILGKTVRQSTRENQTFWKELDIGIRRGMTWGIAMSAIYGNVRKVKDGIGFIQQLDKELTQVSIVSGKTREETSKLAQEYAKLGKEMNKTVTEISAVNTELVRQGLSLEESQKRLLTVMKLNAVSDVDMNPTETLKVITSSVNALKTEAENAADVILKASTISASSVGEIGDALTKTASSAQATGLKIEQVSSIIATLEEVTQESSSSLGNSVKTLLARFNKVDEETGGLNKNLNDVQKAFESVGVTFTEADGSIRSFYDLMTDLNAKGFKDMDKNTKSYIANMAAGVRQQNRFIALADNWSRVVDIQDELVNSAGTLDQAYGQWLNSTEASANRAKIALEQMWINTINSDAIKGFYELSTAITTIIDKLGAMNVAVFVLSTIMLKGNDSVRRFLMNLSQLPSLMSISIAEMGLFKGSLFALGAAMDITALKGKIMWGAITLGASFAITKAIEGITKLINKQSELRHSNEELSLNYKNTTSDINSKQQRLSELGNSYDTIRNKIDNHINLSESEKSTLKEITDMFPELIKGYDNQGNAIIDTTKSVDGLNESLEKLIDVERRAFLEGSNDIFKETGKDIKKAQQAIDDLNRQIWSFDNDIIQRDGIVKEYLHKSTETQKQQYEAIVEAKGEESKEAKKTLENIEKEEEARQKAVEGMEVEAQKRDEAIAKRKEVAATVAEVMSEYKKMPNVLKNIVQEQINEINMMDISADEMTKKVQDLVKSLSNNKLNTAILDYDGLVRQYKLGELTAEQFDKAVQELIKTLLTIEGIDKDLITRLFPESNNIKSIADDTLDLTTYFQVMGGVVSEAVDEYELFNNALYELQTEGHLSRATLDDLLKIFPDLIEQTGLQKDELIKLINTQKDARVETIDSQIAQTKATMEGVWQRITGYQTEIEAMKAVAEARKALAGIEAWDSGIRTGDPELDAYMENKYGEARATIHRAEIATIEMDKLKNKLSGLQGMKKWFGDADKSYKDKLDKHSKKNKKKEKKEDKPNFIDSTDAEIRAIQSKNDNLEKSNELLREQLDLAKDIEGIEGLNKQYEINGKLIENNKKLLKSYKDEQISLHDKANNLRNKNKKYNIDSWFDANGEQTQAYINQYNKLSKKEQEHMDKVFIQMQKYKKAWMDSNKEIKNTNDSLRELNLNTITTQFEIADAKLKSLTDSFADLEYQSQLLADDDYTGKADNTAQKIGILKAQVEQAKKELEELNKKGFKEGSKEAELYTQRQEELTQRIKDGTLSINQYEKALKDLKETARQEWIGLKNEQAREQQERLQALDRIQEAVVAIIRKRGEAEKKALDEAHKAEMDSLEERHNERKKKYQEDLDEFKKMIQAKIDALDEQYEEEDYLEQLNKEREEANRLQKEIDILSLDDSLTARNKVIELRKQLADQNEKIAKMQQKKERDLLKKSLQDQLKQHEKDAKDKEDIADKTYENEKKRLEEDYQINKEFLERKYSDEQVYAEARESIMRGTVETAEGMFEDIYDAYVDFENKFGRGMGILGDIIRDDFIRQLEDARDAIDNLDYMASNRLPEYDSDYQPSEDEYWDELDDYDNDYDNRKNRPSDFMDWSDEDYDEYIANKRAWNDEKNELERNRLNLRNMMLRYKYWGIDRMHEDKYSWKDLINWVGSYDKGGVIPRDGVANVHKNEMYINPSQQKKLWDLIQGKIDVSKLMSAYNFMPNINAKMPNVVPRQDTIYHIDKIFDISGTVTKDTIPLIRKEANGIAETLKNLNKSGVFRPVKI